MLKHCPLCVKETKHGVFVRGMYALGTDSFDLVRCSHCGLIRVDPVPSAEQVSSLYSEDYFLNDYGSGLNKQSYFESQKFLEKRYKHLLDLIDDFKRDKGSLLEVGCAGGYFLNMAHERGWDVSGIEISPTAGDFAKKVVPEGLILSGVFPDIMLQAPNNSYDVVYMGHVLEHCRDVDESLRAAHRLLKPDGLLLVEVPSYVSGRFYKTLLLINKVYKIRTSILKLPNVERKPYHLFEFSKATLKAFLRKNGFKTWYAASGIDVPQAIEHRPFFVFVFWVVKVLGWLFRWQMEYLVAVGVKK